MKRLTICLLILFGLAGAAPAQVKEANPRDVDSIDSIIRAVYESISGNAGEARDWDRFRSLFHKDARLIPSGKNPNTGVTGANAISPDDYIKRVEPIFARDGFFEREMASRKEVFGNIAHVFSTYESFRKSDEKKPFMRGINSIQLLNDGKRWWIISIFWQAETPESPIPKRYLR